MSALPDDGHLLRSRLQRRRRFRRLTEPVETIVRPPELRARSMVMSRPSRDPLVRSVIALSIVLTSSLGAFVVRGDSASKMLRVVFLVVAAIAFAAFLLIILRAAAIQEIAVLNARHRRVESRLERATAHLENVTALVSFVGHSFEAAPQMLVGVDLRSEILRAAVKQLSNIGCENPRLAVVKVEATHYLVIEAEGFRGPEIQRGTSCSAARPLPDIARHLAPNSHAIYFAADDQEYSLVALSDSRFGAEDGTYLELVATTLSLVANRDLVSAEAGEGSRA